MSKKWSDCTTCKGKGGDAWNGPCWDCHGSGKELIPVVSPTDTCWVFEDGLDGYVIHAQQCPHIGQGWTDSNRCIGKRTWRGITPQWAK